MITELIPASIVSQIERVDSVDFQQAFTTQLSIQIKYQHLIANRARYDHTQNLSGYLNTLTAIQSLDNQIKLTVYQQNYSLTQLVEQLTAETKQALSDLLSQRNALPQVIARLRQENAGIRQTIIRWERALASKIVEAKQSWWDYGFWRATQAMDWIGNLSLGGIAKLYVCRQTTAFAGMREGIALATAMGVYTMLPTIDFAAENESEWQTLAWQSSNTILNVFMAIAGYYGSRQAMEAIGSKFPTLNEPIDIRWHLGTGLSLSFMYTSGMSLSYLLIPLSHTLAMTFKQQQQCRVLNHVQADLTPDRTIKYIQPMALVIGIHALRGIYKAWSRQMTLPLWQSTAFLMGTIGSRFAAIPLLQLDNDDLNQANTQLFLYLLATSCGEGLSLITEHGYSHYLNHYHHTQIADTVTKNLAEDKRVTDYTVTILPSVWSPRFWLGMDKRQIKAAWTRSDGLLHQKDCSIEFNGSHTSNLTCEYSEISAIMPSPG